MNKTIKILLKIAALLLGIAAILFLGLYLKYNSPLPAGTEGQKADELAFNISKSIGYEAYQNTPFIRWDFGEFSYEWNKKEKVVAVKWKGNHVLYNQNFPNNSEVLNPKNISTKEKRKLIVIAESKFNNDSFWLVAPFKLFDKGVKRNYIEATEGQNASLLVTYTSGGTTPGDSYQWFVDDYFVPTHFKMWVNILPIGGLSATWSNWKKTETGMFLANEKKLLDKIALPISNIKTWNPKEQ